MAENNNQKSKSEEDFEELKFAGCFSNLLNLVALGLIIAILAVLYDAHYSKIEIKNETIKKVKSELVLTGNSKVDIEKFNSLMDEKLKEFENLQKESEKTRNENMKYYGTLFSLILSIVGFFGFKSIHDTRQSAMESVKVKAGEVAKIEAKIEAEKAAKIEAKLEAEKVAKVEVEKYLEDNKGEIFRYIENPINETYRPLVNELSERIDELERPEAFYSKFEVYDEKINDIKLDLNKKISDLEKRLLEKEIELIKLKLEKN